MRQKIIFVLILTQSYVYLVWGQNIENIGKEKPIKINGGITFSQIFYNASGRQSGRLPYTYYLAGNLNLNIYGLAIPFSYIFSNQQSSFQQPFNQYCLHPTYKWVTGHVGYASMTLSPYTLNGHQFLGIGVEFAPGTKFRFSAMYGRLRRALEYDSISGSTVEPSYKRMGLGFKAGYNLKILDLEVTAFKSKDDKNSLHNNLDTLRIFPEENIAFSVSTGLSLAEKLKFQVEYGNSIITRDTRSDVYSENIIYSDRTSTGRFNAVRAGLKYTETLYSAGISYERIDPGYRTHGSYYFNNDLENITGNLSAILFKKKLNLGCNVGFQRDDLNHKKMSNMVRLVNAYNIGFVPFQQLNINASYSNFKSHTNIKSQFERINQLTPYDDLDTLNFTQITNNSTLNVNYNISSTEKSRQYLGFNGSYQKASEYQEQVLTNGGARFLSLNLSHNYSFVKSNTSFSFAFNYSNSNTSTLKTYTLGPTLSIRKNFFDNKMRNSISAGFCNSYSNSTLLSNYINLRLSAGYVWRKKHNLNLNGAVIRRNLKNTTENRSFTEYTVTLGYNYNF